MMIDQMEIKWIRSHCENGDFEKIKNLNLTMEIKKELKLGDYMMSHCHRSNNTEIISYLYEKGYKPKEPTQYMINSVLDKRFDMANWFYSRRIELNIYPYIKNITISDDLFIFNWFHSRYVELIKEGDIQIVKKNNEEIRNFLNKLY